MLAPRTIEPIIEPTHASLPAKHRPKIISKLFIDRTGGATAIDFSPDGKLLLTVSDNMNHTLTIWDWKLKERLVEGKCGPSSIYNARFNPFQHYVDNEHDMFSEKCYTITTSGARTIKIWTLQYAEEVTKETYTVQRTPFESSRGNWRPSFRNSDKDGASGRVNYDARARRKEEINRRFRNGRNRNAMRWSLRGSGCEPRNRDGYNRSDDLSLAMCFLKDGNGGGAVVVGSSIGDVTFWHQQVEEGAMKLVPRKNSKRGLADRIIMSWDPIAWQGMTMKQIHSGAAITSLAALREPGTDRQAQFVSAGKDNNLILWDVNDIQEHPLSILKIPLDSHAIGILNCGSKLIVSTAGSGIFDLVIGEDSEDIAPTVMLSAHRQCVEAIDTHPTLPIFATCSHDKTVRLWSIKERKVMAYALLAVAGSSIAFSQDGTFAIGKGLINHDEQGLFIHFLFF